MMKVSKREILFGAAISAALVVAVALVFGQTVRHEFVNFDDNTYIYNNPNVAKGFSFESIRWAFTTFHASNWHPLTWLSHLADCHLYGVNNPGGHHLTNVALHAAVAVSLFWVLWRMTGGLWTSAFAAAVFAVHPLRAESVAWVAERKDLLCGLFFMLTLAAYLGYVRHPFSWRRYGLVVAVFALGLMAKPMLVTLPCVLLLLDYWPLGRLPFSPVFCRNGQAARRATAGTAGCGVCGADAPSAAQQGAAVADASPPEPPKEPGAARRLGFLVLEKLPLLALAAASSVVTSMAQQKALISLDAVPFSMRVSNALVSCVVYIRQFFYPAGLAVFYPYPQGGHPLWKVVAAAAVLLGISLAFWFVRKKRPYLLVGWLWYLGMLTPVIGLVQVGSQAMADRYTYLPQIGLTIAVTWGAADLLAGWRFHRWAGAAVSVALVGTLLGAAWRQTDYWRDGETLWRRALSCTERNAVAHNNLATILMDRNKPSDAADHYRKAVEILPAFSVLRDNLGNALEAEGKSEEAAAEYRRAQEGPILDAVEHYRLAQTLASTPAAKATVYNNLGNALAALGREEEAAAEFRRALECKPEYAEARNNLANVLAARGRLDEAIAEYRRALADNPDYVEAQGNLGAALARLGRLDEAVARFRKVLELSPDNAAAYNNLGMVFERQGNLADAIRQWREAVRLAPSNVHYVNRLARALATAPDAALRDGAAAVELAQWAVQRTKGREAVPFDTLAAALAEAGQFPAAIDAARRALRLAERDRNAELAESVKKKIALYEAKTPFHESPTSPPNGAPTEHTARNGLH